MPNIVKLNYITWRDGRPRFNPSARERELGFKGQDLKHPDGTWFSFEEARAWSELRQADIVAARSATAPLKAEGIEHLRRSAGGTVGDLLDDWLIALTAEQDPHYKVRPATLATYRSAIRSIKYRPGTAPRPGRMAPPTELFALTPVVKIDAIALHDFFKYLRVKRGEHTAALCVAAFSAAWAWGTLDRRWRLKADANPRKGLQFPSPAGRVVVFTDAEIRHLVATADRLGHPSIGDGILLGLFTAQRQADRIALQDEGLVDGRHNFRQSKTGKLVAIRPVAELADRLAGARVRAAELKLARGTRPDTILVNEATGREYTGYSYWRAFDKVRAAAAKTMPSLAGKRDQDLRDTAITWLARAGCTMAEIIAVSGHSPRSIQLVLKHYLEAGPEIADASIDKLETWLARERITVA